MIHHGSTEHAAAYVPFPSRRSLRRRKGLHPSLPWFLLVLCLSTVFSVSVAGAPGSCVDGSLRDICSGSASFCFPSTLRGFGSLKEDSCKEPGFDAREGCASSEWRSGSVAAFKMASGGAVSCRLVDTVGGIDGELSSGGKNSGGDAAASCMAPLVPDVSIRMLSMMTAGLDDHDKDIYSGLLNGSSSAIVEISPPFLDWGENSLYTPSMAFLTVKSAYKNGVLDVYGPFSTDPQYYAYNFEKLQLAPGESASIAFIFLPRWVGSSSAHLVLQTSLGGFIIQARGVAIESPYKIEPLVGISIPSSKSLIRNLSIYNPFDDVLHVEEVSAWVSLAGQTDQSVHVVCQTDALQQSSTELGYFLTDNKLFRVENSKLVLRWLDIRPQKQWDLSAHKTEPILEMRLWPYTDGKIFGAICLKMWSSTKDRMNAVVLPLELEVHSNTNFSYLNGSISLDIEPLETCNKRETVIISLRNDGEDLLSLINNFNKNSFVIKIPCLDVVYANSNSEHGSGINVTDGSYIGGLSHDEEEKYTNARTGSLQSLADASFAMKPKLLDAPEADELILRNWKSQGTVTEVSVLKEDELLFPVVPVGSHVSKWISVHNPSQQPVIMQLVLNSGEIIDQCKSTDELYEHTLSSRFTKIDSLETRIGFSTSDSAITEAFVHPSESALFGPVIFRPSNRCTWRSSALIRNNLSGVEWLPIRALGGSHLLILLEGSEPVRKLEFNFQLPINMSAAELLSHIENTTSLCSHQLSKEIYAKNIGELPLEVKKLQISGTDCALDGFRVQRCKSFTLEPGESVRLLISYEADFSTNVVHRDLELALATGIFVVPMKASLPVYMLNLCRKPFFQTVHWKASLIVFAAVSTLLLLLICTIPHFFFVDTEEYYVKVDKRANTTSKAGKTSHLRSAKISRSSSEDENRKAELVNEYHICHNIALDSPKKTEEKQGFIHQKDITFSPQTVTAKPAEVFDNYNMLEAPQSGGLTIRVVKEKGRRRKKRTIGSRFAAKLEVSSSQSGNSTPSSPLSPSASTPKQAWPLSPKSGITTFAGVSSEEKQQKKHDAVDATGIRVSETEEHRRQSPVTAKSAGNQTTSPSSVNSSGSVWFAHSAAAPSVLATNSPIAPSARAPGPKSSKDKAIKMEENDGVEKEFTYDIWGHHFADSFLVRQKEFTSNMVDASEGDSQSFFVRDPRSLMMMSSTRSVSPGQKSPVDDVTFLDQIN
ncbi:hypothetical protein OPV22_015275 [Ensete ventricosum]|uniref:Transmembrane protein 131-like N-terminal domain-containing protein n=1 Tax=Ensete ventricosum TaxID=4639 RepID=A0AAV8PLB5_ENSVE|nr:hypothetical protein OPV22_015275 [Ensete ventricosum]